MAEVHLVVGCAADPAQPARRRPSAASPGTATGPRSASGTCCAPPRPRSSSQALLGGLLVFTGHEPATTSTTSTGLLPLLVSFLAEGARVGAAERELRDIDMESLSADAQQASPWRSSAARWGSWPSAAASSSSSPCAPPAPAAPSSPSGLGH